MSSAPRLFAVSTESRKRPRDVPALAPPRSSPPLALSPHQIACGRCTYLNDDASVLCEMCGEELPLPHPTSALLSAAVPRAVYYPAVRPVDDEPISIDDDDEKEVVLEEELLIEDEVVEWPGDCVLVDSSPLHSSSPPPLPPPQPPCDDCHSRDKVDIPPSPRSDGGSGLFCASTSAFSSLFFSTAASSSTSYPAPASAPSILLPLSYIHPPTLPFVSPLSSAMLSARRFTTLQSKGEMALLCVQLLVDDRIDTQLLTPLLACLCQLGVQYRLQQLPVAYSVEVYEREISYEEYKERHERLAEEKDDGKAAVNDGKSPVDTLTGPLSTRVIPTFFLLIAPRIFCRMYGSRHLHAQLKQLEVRAKELQRASGVDAHRDTGQQKEEEDEHSADSSRYQSPFSVHIVLWGLVSLVAQQKQERKDHRAAAATTSTSSAPPPTLPFSSVSSLTSLSSLWLRSGGVCQVEMHHASSTNAVSALLLHFRHAASARYKRVDEERMFTFGSLRVVKGRTSAMKGANPKPRRKRKRNSHSSLADGSDSSDQSTDDSDDDAQLSAANDSGSAAASVLLSYSESWVHMLCMITGVSEERAAVITRHYPAVRALTNAYQAVHTSTRQQYDEWKSGKQEVEQAGRKRGAAGRLVVIGGETDEVAVARIASERCGVLLADLMVGQRRLGEEISKRVYRMLMT